MVPDTGEFGILIPVILGNVDFAPDDGFDAVTLACRIEISRAVQVAVIVFYLLCKAFTTRQKY